MYARVRRIICGKPQCHKFICFMNFMNSLRTCFIANFHEFPVIHETRVHFVLAATVSSVLNSCLLVADTFAVTLLTTTTLSTSQVEAITQEKRNMYANKISSSCSGAAHFSCTCANNSASGNSPLTLSGNWVSVTVGGTISNFKHNLDMYLLNLALVYFSGKFFVSI